MMITWRNSLPRTIKNLTQNCEWQPISEGESDADVILLVGEDIRYLKVSSHKAQYPVRNDYERLNWLSGRILVPEILAYEESETQQFLLMAELKGIFPFHDDLDWSPQERITFLAQAARKFHALSIEDCPFRNTIEGQLAVAEVNIDLGRVRADLFEPQYQGRDPSDLYEKLVSLKPENQDWVVIHGDMYPLNIRADAETHELLGYIDVGDAAVADPYTDFAPIVNAIKWHFGEEWILYFFEAYGGIEPDWDKLRFYQLLNEFF
jgi:aminoglycoside phosphotransferase